jgi:hypothetical protein
MRRLLTIISSLFTLFATSPSQADEDFRLNLFSGTPTTVDRYTAHRVFSSLNINPLEAEASLGIKEDVAIGANFVFKYHEESETMDVSSFDNSSITIHIRDLSAAQPNWTSEN